MNNNDTLSSFEDHEENFGTIPKKPITRRQAPQVPFWKQYLVPLFGGGMLLCVACGFVYFKFLPASHQDPYASLQSVRTEQPMLAEQPVAHERRLPQSSAPRMRERV